MARQTVRRTGALDVLIGRRHSILNPGGELQLASGGGRGRVGRTIAFFRCLLPLPVMGREVRRGEPGLRPT